MSPTLLSFTLVLVAFGLKIAAVTFGAALLRKHCPDGLAAWLASWIVFQAAMILAMLGLSIGGLLSGAAVWTLLILSCAAIGLLAWRQRVSFGLWSGVRAGSLGFVLFAGVFAIVAARAAIYQDFTWDAQTYGLVRLGIWMNYGSILVHMPTVQLNVFTNEWNGELIALLYGLAAGNLQGFMFGPVEILAVTYCSAAWLAFRLGARPFWASLVGAIIAATPACLGLAGVIKGDLLAGTALLIAAGWLTTLPSHPVIGAAMLTASLALAVGSKITTVLGALGLAVGSLVIARKAHWPSLIRGAAFGLALTLIILSRNVANFIVYGDPLKRIAGESARPGVDTLLAALDFVPAMTFRFSVVQPGLPAFGWLLAAGMGLTMFIACGAMILQWASGARPSGTRLLLIVAALAAACATAFLTPTFQWSFRYYLPMLMIVAVALMAAPLSALRIVPRLTLVAGTVLAILVNGSYVFWPGEINGNNTFEATVPTVLPATPRDRALLMLPQVRQGYGVDEFDFDGLTPQTFAVLAEFDRPVSPLIGSRAQNRLYLASSMRELVDTTRTRCPDFAVVTKGQPAGLAANDRAAIEDLGYDIAKESEMAVVAKRRPDRKC